MVLEIAEFAIQPGREDDFAAAYKEALPLAEAVKGFQSARMVRSIESPSVFVLLIEWDTLEAHTEGFRKSPGFIRWRELIGPYFAGDPRVQHGEEI